MCVYIYIHTPASARLPSSHFHRVLDGGRQLCPFLKTCRMQFPTRSFETRSDAETRTCQARKKSTNLNSEDRGCLEEGCLGLSGVLPDISWIAIFRRKSRRRWQEPELPDLAWNSRRPSPRHPQPTCKLLSLDIFRWGRGLPREGVGAKKFGMSLETREIKLFGRDIPGFCRDIPEEPEKFEKKRFGFNSRPLTWAQKSANERKRAQTQGRKSAQTQGRKRTQKSASE